LLAVCSFIEDRVELMRAYYGFMRDVHPVTGEALDYE
jgi:hypothetical protein